MGLFLELILACAGSILWVPAFDMQGYGMAKKSAFLAVFLLTLFENMLKYPHVCQQANINRQQAKKNRHFSSHVVSSSAARTFGPAGPAAL